MRPDHGVRLAAQPGRPAARAEGGIAARPRAAKAYGRAGLRSKQKTAGQVAALLRAVRSRAVGPSPQVLFAGMLAPPRRVRDGPRGRRHTHGDERQAQGGAQKPRPARQGPRLDRPGSCSRHGPPRLLCAQKPQRNYGHGSGPSGRLSAQMGGGRQGMDYGQHWDDDECAVRPGHGAARRSIMDGKPAAPPEYAL